MDEMTCDVLNGAIRGERVALENMMRTRRAHPSYGITKGDLRDRLNVLVGMLFAYGAVMYDRNSASAWMQAEEIADEFGFDLSDLRERVREA